MTNKKGFTLSEVMVAVGILGVLAAMLVPALMNSAPDNGKVMFKKAYSSFERVVSDLINDNTNYPAKDEDIGGGVMVNSGFHQTGIAGTTVPAGQNKFCYLLADKLNTVAAATCSTNPGTFTTTDGIFWQVYAPASQFTLSSTDYGTTVTVTVTNKPACSIVAFSNPTTTACAAGKSPNTFKINVRYDGKIQVDPADTAARDILQNPTNNKKS